MKRNQQTGKFEKQGQVSLETAVQMAYNTVSDVFYLNSVEKVVHNIMKPQRSMTTSISTIMRRLRRKGKINFKANELGVYEKLVSLNPVKYEEKESTTGNLLF